MITETLAQHADRLIAARSRKAISDAHYCDAHLRGLAMQTAVSLHLTHRYDDRAFAELSNAARVAILKRTA